MAFRAPTQLPQRLVLSSSAQPSLQIQQDTYQQPLDDSQEWVLFSPSQATSTTRTQTTSTDRTPRTAGLSRVSEFGSLETAARSGEDDEELSEDALDDAELDSLDDGLHAFREPSVYRLSSNRLDQSGGTVLPTHDGLGTFPASSPPVQEHLYQFEQYNPKRKFEGHHTRRSSVQRRLDAVEDRETETVEDERRLRIEQWRMEQSKALLDEIEKETRRRRSSRASDRFGSMRQSVVETMEIVMEDQPVPQQSEEKASSSDAPAPEPYNEESFLQRVTRRVIRDLIGIDDTVLSAIFGETLVPEQQSTPPPPSTYLSSSTFEFSDHSSLFPVSSDITWQDRLLERIAREVGILVNQLSEYPGAFTAYLQPNERDTPDYAGLPMTRTSTPRPSTHTPPLTAYESAAPNPYTSTVSPVFSPTLGHQPYQVHHQNTAPSTSSHAELWGIEDSTHSTVRTEREREYWERDIDLKTLFRFLRNRFRQSSSSPQPPPSRQTQTQDTAHRTAIIRAHHPLVARAHATTTGHLRRSSSGTWHQNTLLKRQGSSCASASTKGKRGSISGSSRNYWDIGGSVISGSERAVGVGAWGEV